MFFFNVNLEYWETYFKFFLKKKKKKKKKTACGSIVLKHTEPEKKYPSI